MLLGCPKILRVDKGTENVLVGTAQIALCLNNEDSMSGNRSLIAGASVHNVVGMYICKGCSRYLCLFNCRKLKVGGHTFVNIKQNGGLTSAR